MDADKLLQKIGGGAGKKAKGLPKRTKNPAKKSRMMRSIARIPEKKLRHVIRRNGMDAAIKRVKQDKVGVSVFRKVCLEMHIDPPL